MINIYQIDGHTVAALVCDRCGVMLPGAIPLRPGLSPTVPQRIALRDAAQVAGWTFSLVSIFHDGHRDWCPMCFTLPPEG